MNVPQKQKDRSQHEKALAAACRVANIPIGDFIGIHGRQFGEMWSCRYLIVWLLYWKAKLGVREIAVPSRRSRTGIDRILKQLRHPLQQEAGAVFVAIGKFEAAGRGEEVEPMTLREVQIAVRALRVPLLEDRPTSPQVASEPTPESQSRETLAPGTSS